MSTDNHLCGASFHEAAVKLITIDECMAEKEVDHLYMLKTDVEGNELGVLQGDSKALAAGKIRVSKFKPRLENYQFSNWVALRT